MNKQGKDLKYDVVVTGAGVHGVIAAATLMRTNPNLRVLIVENSDTAAANFRLARDMFRIKHKSGLVFAVLRKIAVRF